MKKILFLLIGILMLSCNNNLGKEYLGRQKIQEREIPSTVPYTKVVLFCLCSGKSESSFMMNVKWINGKVIAMSFEERYGNKDKYYKISYPTKIAFLTKVLAKLSQEQEISNLKQIFMKQDIWNEKSILLSVHQLEGNEKEKCSNEIIAIRIKQSAVLHDLKKILTMHHLRIQDVSLDNVWIVKGSDLIKKRIPAKKEDEYFVADLCLDISYY